jgi:hypothetical protein
MSESLRISGFATLAPAGAESFYISAVVLYATDRVEQNDRVCFQQSTSIDHIFFPWWLSCVDVEALSV